VQTGSTWPGVPHLRDLVRESHWPIVDLVMAPDTIGVPLIGPPAMPEDVTSILRKAFLAMGADKDYQADAEKVRLPVGSQIGGAEVAAKISVLAGATSPEVVAEFNRLSGSR